MVRVLIADDHRLFAEALDVILSTDGRIDVVGCAYDGREAVDLARELRPDVVLMDIAMPVLDGIEATREIEAGCEGTRVLVLTGSNAPEDIARARAAGAADYITKDEAAAELVKAILRTAQRVD
jgi:DNA-binding NarL/FixJ family response regulator